MDGFAIAKAIKDHLPSSDLRLADDLVAYLEHKGYEVYRGAGENNIIYLEGADEAGWPNADRIDDWDDRRIVLVFQDGVPVIVLNALCTTEPGLSATTSPEAKKRKGVARIAFGQHKAWALGWHKKASHPALVQVRNLPVCRDLNMDFKRTGDRVDVGVFGINQHSTSPSFKGNKVGKQSEGCLVGKDWYLHSVFMVLCRSDVRYRVNQKYIFSSTIVDGTDFGRFRQARQIVTNPLS